MNQLYTTKEIAELFKVSHITAWRWCKDRRLPAFRIGNEWRVKVTDVEDLIRNKSNN